MNTPEDKGKPIYCIWCSGTGQVNSCGLPDECSRCNGSGWNWRYPSGLLARYYSGPIIGRDTLPQPQPTNGETNA